MLQHSQTPNSGNLTLYPQLGQVTIPAGVKPGQTFLVDVPGRRERDVTAPSGTTPGELRVSPPASFFARRARAVCCTPGVKEGLSWTAEGTGFCECVVCLTSIGC
eukprot:3602465-Rhodomonas_salina.2